MLGAPERGGEPMQQERFVPSPARWRCRSGRRGSERVELEGFRAAQRPHAALAAYPGQEGVIAAESQPT